MRRSISNQYVNKLQINSSNNQVELIKKQNSANKSKEQPLPDLPDAQQVTYRVRLPNQMKYLQKRQLEIDKDNEEIIPSLDTTTHQFGNLGNNSEKFSSNVVVGID